MNILFAYKRVSGYIMTRHFTTTLLLFTLPTFGQNNHCFCDKDTLMNEAMVSCDTTTFSNNAKLYWQYNCDSIWLTLENVNGQKNVIDEVPDELYGYTYRLGFHLIKEFDKTILFRSGCPANGPCIYTLIDKNNGKTIEQFDQLICIDTDAQWNDAHKYDFDFIVYLTSDPDNLVVYFVDSGQTVKKTFTEKLTGIIPQHQFNKMTLEKNILTISYVTDDDVKKNITINLNDKKYGR
ncbi:MAG: hypothetical protein KDE33_12240 [Bacteroidetes bacterium]|nr:hypothetical protein [Bacteroidota bacterium]